HQVAQQGHGGNGVDHAGFPQPAVIALGELHPQPGDHGCELFDDPRWLLHGLYPHPPSPGRGPAEPDRRELAHTGPCPWAWELSTAWPGYDPNAYDGRNIDCGAWRRDG